MRIRTIGRLGLCVATLLTLTGTQASGAADDVSERHCAYRLIPRSRHNHVIEATRRLVGCYPSFAIALRRGSDGNIQAPDGLQPQDLTQSMLDGFTVDLRGSALIGTEYKGIGQTGGSTSYTAPDTCQGNTWEVTNLQGADNDNFESGEGFGGCDHNKKFAGPWLAGADLTCTPDCNNYGSLKNDVSSLRWRP
jgi:hypothetical protein